MNRKSWRMCLSVVMVLGLLACAAKPVFAEAPPPPTDDPGGPVPLVSSVEPVIEEPTPQPAGYEEKTVEASEVQPAAVAAPLADLQDYLPPLLLGTDSARPALSAEFTADGQMLDANGVLRAQGETLAALIPVGAIACPLGKVPLVYGGSSNTGCTPYYDEAGFTNPIQSAHDHPLTKATWWIWVSPSYLKPWGTTLTKSVTVAGDPRGTSVASGIGLNAPNITLRELVIHDGRIYSSGQSGTLRLLNVAVGGTIPGAYGIDISGHRGSVILSGVAVAVSHGGGALLDTTGGSGTVTVLNSAFNYNTHGDGLQINANNAVRVENVSAVLNGKVMHGGGLWIRYRNRLTLKNIYTYDNFDWGVNAQDTHPTYGGPVTLQNITANENDIWAGIWLIDPGPLSGNNLTANGNDFEDGIKVQDGRSSITLSGVTALGNIFAGVNISNGGSVSVSNSRVGDNWKNGLTIYSRGPVTVKNSIFYSNKNAGGGGNGVYINNSTAATAQSVTLTNINAVQNEGFGIYVLSKGTTSLSGITMMSSHYGGAHIETNSSVTVSSSYGTNTFNENGTGTYCASTPDVSCDGLYIDTKGSVSISSTSAIDNAYEGIRIVNPISTRLTGVIANSNRASGIYINAKGPVSVSSSVAAGNGWDGMGIENATSTRVTDSTANKNFMSGVYINGLGSITIDRVTALHNHGRSGLFLLNTNLPAGSPTMTLSHVVADNNLIGVEAYARGPVTLNHASASFNHWMGMYIDNSAGGAGVGSVTLTNSLGSDLISSNFGNNLAIRSRGSVNLSGVNASGSATGLGAEIITTDGPGNVSVSSSVFNDNGDSPFIDYGLGVQSNGSISLSSVTASGNKGIGAVLQNQMATLTGKTVTVKKSVFNNNGNLGLNIVSQSSVTLDNVVANWNNGHGARIDNYSPGGTASVNVLNTLGRNQFSMNTAAGLHITTGGNVTVRQTDASGAAGGWSGIEIYSYGANKTALFYCVSALNNSGYGIYLMQLAGSSMKLTLQGVGLVGNGSDNLSYSGTPVVQRTVCQ